MGSDPTSPKQRRRSVKKSLSPRLQKLEADFEKAGGEWWEVELGEVFEIYSPKKRFNANNLTFGGRYPYVARGDRNNGIRGYIDEDVEYLSPANSISFGQDTATMFYQKEAYFTGDKIKVFKMRNEGFNHRTAQFFISAMRKSFSNFSWGSSSYNELILKTTKTTLPYLKNEIAFSYMENYIKALEAERIETLEAYLTVTGLKDYRLTEKDEQILDRFAKLSDTESRVQKWGSYAIADIFYKLDLKCRKKDFDKAKDTSRVPTSEFNIPLVNAKIGDNGIMFYGRISDFDTATMTIDIISNGAVATGTVYPQIQKVGVLWDAYLLKSKKEIGRQQLFFLATAIEKSIKQRFGWENKAVWNKVKKESISLPTTNDTIDYDFMSEFIRAVEKLVIKDLVEWTDRKIEATKEVVEKG